MLLFLLTEKNTVYAMEENIDFIWSQIDCEQADTYSKAHLPEKMTFSELVENGVQMEEIMIYIEDTLLYEIEMIKPYLMELIAFVFLFALLNKLGLSHICSFVLYGSFLYLLVTSYEMLADIVYSGVDEIIGFMIVLIPVYASSLAFSGKILSSGIFHELIFLYISGISWGLKYIIFPGIHLYLFVGIANQLLEGAKLSKLVEFLEKGISFLIKYSLRILLGMQGLQTLISSAKEQVDKDVITSGLSLIPGVGDVTDSSLSLFLGCGKMIRTSVGFAIYIVIIVVVLVPLIKMGIYFLFYRFLASVMEPISDKGFVEVTIVMGKCCKLFFQMLWQIALFFVISVTLAACSI